MSAGRPDARILHVTDTHFGAGDTRAAANWAVIAELAARLEPDLVVHTGDLMAWDPGAVTDRRMGFEAMEALGLPYRITPGNHDVGDSPSDEPVFGQVINRDWLGAWRDRFGADRWRLDLGAWTLAGVNAMLFGTGWDEEAVQWAWLRDLLSGAAPRPVALFMHKPPYAVRFDEETNDSVSIPAESRARLRALVAGSTLRLIGCGHRHEHRHYLGGPGEPAVLWAPPVAFIGTRSPPVADTPPQPGCVLLSLIGGDILAQVLTPAGMTLFDSSYLHRMLEQARA